LIHPPGPPSPPRSIQNKVLMPISESARALRKSVRHPGNAGYSRPPAYRIAPQRTLHPAAEIVDPLAGELGAWAIEENCARDLGQSIAILPIVFECEHVLQTDVSAHYVTKFWI
jgi:hypothetical protein